MLCQLYNTHILFNKGCPHGVLLAIMLVLSFTNANIQARADYIFPGIISQRPGYVSCPYLDNIEQEEQRKIESERRKAANASLTATNVSSSSANTHNHGTGYVSTTDENGYEIISSYGVNIRKQRRNVDGSISYINQSQCIRCHGTKTCTVCYGKGGRWSGFGLDKMWMTCAMCAGNGACNLCKGNGYTVDTGVYDPVSQSLVGRGPNGNYYVTSNDDGSVSEPKSSKDYEHAQPWHYGNNEPLCPDCKGSGKCHNCQGDGFYYNSYCDKYLQCSLCHNTGTCSMCHGRGSIR